MKKNVCIRAVLAVCKRPAQTLTLMGALLGVIIGISFASGVWYSGAEKSSLRESLKQMRFQLVSKHDEVSDLRKQLRKVCAVRFVQAQVAVQSTDPIALESEAVLRRLVNTECGLEQVLPSPPQIPAGAPGSPSKVALQDGADVSD